MKKIGIFIDAHNQEANPRSRKDSYFLSLLNKENEIANDNDILICAGDYFNKATVSAYITQLKILWLKKWHRKKDIEFYITPGNHDLVGYSLQSLKSTSLGVLQSTGLIKIPDKLEIEGVTFDFLPINREAPEKINSSADVVIAHYYLENERDIKFSIKMDAVHECSAKYLILGHDHEPHPDEVFSGTTVIRMGSLGRNSAQVYNLDRPVCYYQMIVDEGKILSCKPVVLKSAKSGKEVFKEQYVNKPEIKNSSNNFFSNLEMLLDSFIPKAGGCKSILQLMEEVEIPQEVKDIIVETYKELDIPLT